MEQKLCTANGSEYYKNVKGSCLMESNKHVFYHEGA